MDLTTGKATIILKNKASTEFDSWRILSNDKLLVRSWNSQNKVDIWMYDLDGSNMQKHLQQMLALSPE